MLLAFATHAQTLSFTASATSTSVGGSITFTNTSTGFPAGQQFAWRFSTDCGGGAYPSAECSATTYGTAPTAVCTYNQIGTWAARLYSVDAFGNLSASFYSVNIDVDPSRSCCSYPPPSANYVLDGSFENFSSTGGPISISQLNMYSCPWSTAAGQVGTPDILGSNGVTTYTGLSGPANYVNFIGNQTPYDGTHYAGIFTTITDNVNTTCTTKYNYSEYIQQRLYAPLETGKKYKVRFYVSLADSAGKATSIGALLTNSPTTAANATTIGTNINPNTMILNCANPNPLKQGSIMLTPNYTSPTITSKTTWTMVEFIVTGSGQEYITIGHFNDATNSSVTNVGSAYANNHSDAAVISRSSYYYIDNVSVSLVCNDAANSDYQVIPLLPNVSSITGLYGNPVVNKTIYVGYDLTIDQNNVVFQGCTFLMGNDKKIIVPNNTTFTITNNGSTGSTIIGACSAMWNSITLGKGTVLNLNKTAIKDGKNAVYNINGATVNITDCDFNQNDIAVRIDGGGNNPSVFSGTNFRCDQTLMLYPLTGSQASYGIYVSNTTNLSVGGAALSPNNFDGTMLCGRTYGINKGIYATNTTITVRNNTFTQLYTGVEDYNSSTTTTTTTTIGGAAASQPNSYTDCIWGVSISGRNTASVLRNTFNNSISPIGPTAITVADLSSVGTADISNNSIYNHREGILANNTGGATANRWANLNIANNKFDYLSGYLNQRTGIRVNNFSKTPTLIDNNVIKFNIPAETTVTLCTPGGGEDCIRSGIFLNNASSDQTGGSQITNNKISAGTYVPIFTTINHDIFSQRVLGIRIQTSPSTLNGNRLTNLGSGIFTGGNCTTVAYRCDTFDMCLNLFRFDNAIINAQGTSSVGTGCRWLNLCNGNASLNKMVGTFNGSQPAISWWYSGGYNPTTNQLCLEDVNVSPNPFTFFDYSTVFGPCPAQPHRMANTPEDGFDVKGYPNPTDAYFTLEYTLGKDEAATLVIYNLTGGIISNQTITAGSNNQKINTSGYPAGIYYYNLVTTSGKKANGKFIVSH